MKLHLIASLLTLAAATTATPAQQTPPPQQPQGQQPQGQQPPKAEAGDSGHLLPGQQPAATPTPAADQLEKEKAVRPPTQEERIAKLKEQVAKLENERRYLQSIREEGGVVGRIRQFLENRGVVAESFTDKSAPVGPMPAMGAQQQPKPAKKVRLLGDAEKEKLADDVIFTVDGLPVTRPEFDELLTYLKSYPRDESEDQLKQLAILQLIKVKAGEAMLAETARRARGRIAEAQQKIADGADFAAIAKEMSDCPSKASGGDLGFFGREQMDLSFTRAAFSLKPGQVSPIVPSTYGYHLIKATGVKKGDAPEQDQVQASHLLVLYNPDQARVMEAQSKVSTGEVDVAFRSDELRKHAPDFLK